MKIIFTQHAKDQMKIRSIDRKTMIAIIKNPQEKYYDTIQKSFVSISKVKYKNKYMKICVFFQYEGENVKIRTTHPESDHEVKKRILNRRYI